MDEGSPFKAGKINIGGRTSFILGIGYYPEQCDESLWDWDLGAMREAGLDVIRICEYAWSRMEPKEGAFDFDWLDRVFEAASRWDMKVVLGTPTDAPPPWVRTRYPEAVMVDENGLKVSTGGRSYRCPSSKTYRRLTRRIVEQMARRYGNHPQLVGWQIDNEIGGVICFCPSCRAACRAWLQEKYKTVEALNKAWGLVFWSHEFSDWDEVDLPRRGMNWVHPAAQLDVRRFFSHIWIDFVTEQVDLIRTASPGRFVTHNIPHVGIGLDLFELAEPLDFIGVDMYPRSMIDARWEVSERGCYGRSVQKQPHWVMELTTGSPVTQFYKSPVPREGQIRQWTHQNAAYGAQGVMYFCWRKRPSGYEMLSNGLLNHDSVPRRYYFEVKRTGEEFAKLARVLPSYDSPPEVAIVSDFVDRMNAQINPMILDVPFRQYVLTWLKAARLLGLNVRFVRSTDDLGAFPLVVTLNQYTSTPQIAANLKSYVAGGGTLIATNRIGIFDVRGNPRPEQMPGGMQDLFGIEIDEYERCMDVNPNALNFQSIGLGAMDCRDWVFILELKGATPIAVFERQYYAGRPGATRHRFGGGEAIYLGTMLTEHDTKRFLAHVAKGAGLDPLPLDWDEDVEIVRLMTGDGESVWAVFNHALEPKEVALPEESVDVLTGERFSRTRLEPADVRWLWVK